MPSKKSNQPTIFQINGQKVENFKKSRKQLAEFNLYRFPTPTKKKIDSISNLKKRIAEFFEQYEVNSKTKANQLPLPSDLALFLGFSSYKSMAAVINSPIDPEWSAEIEKAVEHINSMLMRSELDIAQRAKDVRGIDNILKRIDKENESTIPKTEDPKNQINIQINIEHKRKIDDFVSDRISNLMKGLKEEEPITDIEYEEAEE